MHYLDPKDLTQRENYKLLIGSIIPRPVAVVSTQSADGIVNIAPFSFFNIVSSEPVILSLAIQRKRGTERHRPQSVGDERSRRAYFGSNKCPRGQ